MVYEMLDAVVLGGLGGAVYLYMTYCIYKIVEHISGETQETALTKLMIDEDGINAFKTLAISTTAVAVLFTGRIFIQVANMEMRPSPFIVLLPIPLAGIAYFFHQIKEVTARNTPE